MVCSLPPALLSTQFILIILGLFFFHQSRSFMLFPFILISTQALWEEGFIVPTVVSWDPEQCPAHK